MVKLGKTCPSCETQYNDKVKKCPKDHCPNCGTDKISNEYQYYPINFFLLNGASIDGIVFLVVYAVIGVILSIIYTVFLSSYITLPYNGVLYAAFYALIYFLIVTVYNTNREYESDNKPPRIQIGYKCNNCQYSFEFPDTMIVLENDNE
jgi:hypothetical protein